MSKIPHSESRRSRVWLFWLLALLLHVLLALWFSGSAAPVKKRVAELAPLKLRFRRPAKQIVDTHQAERKPRKPTDLIAPKASATKKEQIARTVGPTENNGGQPATQKQAPRPSLKGLLPDAAALASREPSRQSNYIKRPEGPVTLLNAESAPWSQWLINSGYRVVRYLNLNAELMTWYLQDFQQLHFPAEVRFVLRADGSVAETRITRSSGSGKVDQWFREAALSGFTGQAPPEELLAKASTVQLIAQLYADHIALGRP